jgi:hypothetical protein
MSKSTKNTAKKHLEIQWNWSGPRSREWRGTIVRQSRALTEFIRRNYRSTYRGVVFVVRDCPEFVMPWNTGSGCPTVFLRGSDKSRNDRTLNVARGIGDGDGYYQEDILARINQAVAALNAAVRRSETAKANRKAKANRAKTKSR